MNLGFFYDIYSKQPFDLKLDISKWEIVLAIFELIVLSLICRVSASYNFVMYNLIKLKIKIYSKGF